jgi:neutral ceramidase
MGWGDPTHRALKVALPIHTRATVFKTGTAIFALACLEICFLTQAVRNEVLKRLQAADPATGWTEDNVLLCATHTHCAPGGHTHDVLYNVPSFGYYPHVLDKYAEGTTAAILEASKSLRDGRIRFAEGEFGLDKNVAFNRSVQAWNENPENEKLNFDERARALDRKMRMFRFEDLEGRFIGCLNEFAVHCTSVHRDYPMIHSDNKGVAAEELESKLGGVCIFVQGASGDSSPNFQRFPGLREVRGTDRDDLESARTNGHMQAEMALSLCEKAAREQALSAELDSAIDYVDFSKVHVDPKDVGGRENCQTGPAVIGARALLGTDEGMPTPKVAYHAMRLTSRLIDFISFVTSGGDTKFLPGRDPIHGPKPGCIQSGESKVFRSSNFGSSLVPSFLGPAMALVKTWSRKNLLSRPLTPQILPIQSIRVGEWVWISVPAEFTTTSGVRLKKSVLEDLRGTWARRALLIGYANSYSGYVTTPEEYQLQLYEGASTHFGQWTQPAYQTAFRKLMAKLQLPRGQRSSTHVHPPMPTESDLREMTAPPL